MTERQEWLKVRGLPTFPIQIRMDLGTRADDEVAWLCQHGYLIDTVVGVYRKITIREGCMYFFREAMNVIFAIAKKQSWIAPRPFKR